MNMGEKRTRRRTVLEPTDEHGVPIIDRSKPVEYSREYRETVGIVLADARAKGRLPKLNTQDVLDAERAVQ